MAMAGDRNESLMEDHDVDIRRLRVLRDDLRNMQANRSHATDRRDARHLRFSDAISAVDWLIYDLARDAGPQITEPTEGAPPTLRQGPSKDVP